jgi:hypothetical protein
MSLDGAEMQATRSRGRNADADVQRNIQTSSKVCGRRLQRVPVVNIDTIPERRVIVNDSHPSTGSHAQYIPLLRVAYIHRRGPKVDEHHMQHGATELNGQPPGQVINRLLLIPILISTQRTKRKGTTYVSYRLTTPNRRECSGHSKGIKRVLGTAESASVQHEAA